MRNPNLVLEKMLTIDDTGMPTYPDIRQLQDKDVLELFTRDKSTDKQQYIKECGVIYYLGDPKSPAHQQGCSDFEALKLAIENYNLPKDYQPDELVNKLIKKYYKQNITEAGVALESLRKSLHLSSIASVKINDYLNNKLQDPLGEESIGVILDLMTKVNKQIQEIPELTKSINSAYENLRNEQEQEIARGGRTVSSSMDCNDND